MKKFVSIIKISLIYLLLSNSGLAKQSEYFNEGKKLFQKEKFDKSKIFFERDIAFDPKSEKSYLYLAKIFLNKDLYQMLSCLT